MVRYPKLQKHGMEIKKRLMKNLFIGHYVPLKDLQIPELTIAFLMNKFLQMKMENLLLLLAGKKTAPEMQELNVDMVGFPWLMMEMV